MTETVGSKCQQHLQLIMITKKKGSKCQQHLKWNPTLGDRIDLTQ